MMITVPYVKMHRRMWNISSGQIVLLSLCGTSFIHGQELDRKILFPFLVLSSNKLLENTSNIDAENLFIKLLFKY